MSRTIRTCGRSPRSSAVAARPSASASSAVSSSPATPRTPSVPKSFSVHVQSDEAPERSDIRREARSRGQAPLARRSSALRELRPLAGLLEPRLAALLLRASRVSRPRRLSSPRSSGSISVSARATPWRTAPAWPAMPPPWTRTTTSTLRLVAGGDQRLAGQRAQVLAREVLVERRPLTSKLPLAGAHDHAGDRALALAGRLDPRVGGELDLRAACGRAARRRPRPRPRSRARSSSSASSRARSSAVSSRSGSSAIGSRSAPGGLILGLRLLASVRTGRSAAAASGPARRRLGRAALRRRAPRRRAPRGGLGSSAGSGGLSARLAAARRGASGCSGPRAPRPRARCGRAARARPGRLGLGLGGLLGAQRLLRRGVGRRLLGLGRPRARRRRAPARGLVVALRSVTRSPSASAAGRRGGARARRRP